MKPIPIIDLFAGPGGLGEGFMSVRDLKENFVFDIKLSIEKDIHAHNTLKWRSFYRQFLKKGKSVPSDYYTAYQESNLKKREELIEETLNKYPEGEEAREEVQQIELGSDKWPASVVDELIEERLGNNPGNWVLIGGPPCQAYSNAGRSRTGGVRKEDHRVYLYKEYLRIIKKHKPAVFVMENVKGLLSAKVGNERVFDWMKKDLRVDGKYKLYSFVQKIKKDSDFLIRSEDYGIPQKRHRVIILGIRSDIEHPEKYLVKKPEVELQTIIEKLPQIRSTLNRIFIKYDENNLDKKGNPKRIYKNLKDSYNLWQTYMSKFLQNIERWGELSDPSNNRNLAIRELETGSEYIPLESSISETHPLRKWYNGQDFEQLGGVANHESRSHLTQDLQRYLFAGIYTKQNGTFPRLKDFARHGEELLPDHSNVSSNKFTDRFRVQLKDKAATTITSHISKDGHYFIHYDAHQCRSLTVREAARIQTFPDNYLFRGSRTQQYHQVGNAVPPYLALQLAEIVHEIFIYNSL